MGSYASALFVLGMSEHLTNVADVSHDIVGRELEEESLPKRIRMPQGNKGTQMSSQQIYVSIDLGEKRTRSASSGFISVTPGKVHPLNMILTG